LDCEGTWSACTEACEGIGDRTFTQTQGQFGTGAACPEATDCQPGEGACPPKEWFWSEDTLSCTQVCANNGMSCVDGDWGIHDQEDLEGILGEEADTICNRGYGASHVSFAPYIWNDTCRYRTTWDSQNGTWYSSPGESICDHQPPGYGRICKCVPPSP
jgi:hypothetical protein